MRIIQKEKKSNKPIDIKSLKIGNKKNFLLKITNNLHNQFKKFSGDNSPIHTNLTFCKKNKFKKKVGYAFLITAALSKIYGTHFPGGNELCIYQSCNFKNPFYVNDILLFKIKIIQVNYSMKMITINVVVKCKNKIIFEGESILKLNLINEKY